MTKTLVKEMQKQGYKIKLASEIKEFEKIKTGIFALDYVLDGGIYWGEGGCRLEFFGKESSGKTTFVLSIIKRYQELGKKCMYINAEKSYDKTWGEINGVDNSKLYIAEPDSLEQAGDMICDFLGKYDLIIVDSIPSLIPKEELEDTMEDKKFMASQAKVLSPMTRKFYSAIGDNYTTTIFINQLRENMAMYGAPYTVPGGRAIKHFYNVQVEFKLGKPIEDEEKDKIGYEINLRCTKNKRGKPYRTAIVDFYLDGHLDNNKSLFWSGLKFNIIENTGNTYTFGDKKIVGRDNMIKGLEQEDYKKIESILWEKYLK